MNYEQALEIIEKEFKTIPDSPHNKIIKTGLTYDGFNSFCACIYNKDGVAILTDLGKTKDVFDEVSQEDWTNLCKQNRFEFNHWSIQRVFTKIEDVYDFIKFLDDVSCKYWDNLNNDD